MHDLAVSRSVVIPAHELSWRFSRSSGPGGQSVNTADSRVELSWDVAGSGALSPMLRDRALDRLAGRLVDGVITVTASEHRSQLRNREAALARLAEAVRNAIAPPRPPRKRTRPSAAARERRLADKHRRARLKQQRQSRPDD
ncbi:MAG TPA: alternative ribosome rescue aminoacyl-tRNA hydrolase ArfB [Mycobacteriales bacterium]|jgi:ribosome-associated protein|nr:alternative ribosome rescue aminoacyl-tRNA hydrolase ArfB [Mycobacteriales bacterium]